VKDHGQAKKDGAKLATELKLTPVENSTSGTLREESTMLISRLKDEQANFDHAYISAQVEGHRKVLDLFDKRLIPSARDPKVLAMLQTNRPKIEAHLNEALEIQSALESAGANRAGAMPQSGTGAEQNTPHQHDHSRPSDPSSGAAP
jgi:predicted outer membrane protein